MFKKILPHLCLDMAVIFMVLWAIDRVNGAMIMLGRDVFKIPFFVFLVLVVILSVVRIIDDRKE